MKFEYGNILTMDADAYCITTNGFVKKNGSAVMGRGIAKQVADIYPDLPEILGKLLKNKGNIVHILKDLGNEYIVSFPVKPSYTFSNGSNVVSHASTRYPIGAFVPGYHAKAQLDIIERSCIQLVQLTDKQSWNRVILPYPGCGAGELNWDDVRLILEQHLDDRFVAVTFNKD